jgi:hypothetical protein
MTRIWERLINILYLIINKYFVGHVRSSYFFREIKEFREICNPKITLYVLIIFAAS